MSPVILSKRDGDGNIATVTLSNPDKLNADADLRCVIVRDAGGMLAQAVDCAPLDANPLTAGKKRASFDFLDTADYREGLTAFLEKRPPCFTGQ